MRLLKSDYSYSRSLKISDLAAEQLEGIECRHHHNKISDQDRLKEIADIIVCEFNDAPIVIDDEILYPDMSGK